MDIRVGKVTHFYDRISVAVVELTDDINVGETIRIHGRTTNITQRVGSMEIEHQKIQSAGQGAEVAIKVIEPVREGDVIYKVAEEQENEP